MVYLSFLDIYMTCKSKISGKNLLYYNKIIFTFTTQITPKMNNILRNRILEKTIHYLFALLFIFLMLNGFAQGFSPKWETCLGGTGWDEATGMIKVDSIYWVIAETNSTDGDISFNHGTFDLWLLKIDNNGSLISEKTFGGSYADGGFSDIKKLNDSVFYIVTTSSSIDGDIGKNPWPGPSDNLWILQVNNKGDILWETMTGGSGTEELRDITVTSDGGLIVLGLTTSHDGDVTDHHGGYDLWMIKLNSAGQKLWDMSLGGIGLESGGSIIQTSDGGYMVVGTTDGYGGGNYDSSCNHHYPGSGFIDAWVVKLDSARNIQWQQCYGGTYSDGVYNIIELSNGYIVLGYTMSNDGDVSGYHSYPGPNSKYGGDIWVFKIDKTGNLLWQKCLGGTYDDFARNIFPTTDGGYMIVGSTDSNDGDVEGFHGEVPGYSLHDIWFVKIDSSGNPVWQYCYGGEYDEMIYRGVWQKSDRDYVLAIGTETNDWRCYIEGSQGPDVRIVELKDCSGEPPLPAPDTIFGPEKICTSYDSTYTYQTTKLQEAYTYDWLIVPPEAGQVVSVDSTSADIRWSKYYTGSAALFVRGNNNCNTFEWSPLKTVNIYNCTGIDEQNSNGFKIDVYPNPAASVVHFKIETNGEPKNGNIIIFNAFGKKIIEFSVKKNSAVWHTENLPRGIYFYKYIQAEKYISGRVLLN